MGGHYAESIGRDGKRLDVGVKSAGSIVAPQRPPDGVTDAVPGRSEQPGLARRYGLLAAELGFRLVDLCMVTLAAGVAGEAGHAAISRIPLGVALLMTNIVFSVRGLYRDAPVFMRNL